MAGNNGSPLALRVLSGVLRAGAALLVLALGIGIAAWLIGTRPPPAHMPAADRVIQVRVVAVKAVALPRVWEGYGTARAMESADVSSQVSARVIERSASIEPGVPVRAGDVLVRLDPLDFEQRAEASRALIGSWEAQLQALEVDERRLSDQVEIMQDELRLEERELERIASVVEQRAANVLEVERRQGLLNRKRRELVVLQQQVEATPPKRAQIGAMVSSERANLRLAEENLARATVRAPITGVLQEVFAEPGELLVMGSPIARIVDLSRIEVPLRLPVSAAELIRPGDAVDLRTDSPGAGGASARWSGTIARIAPEADAASRTVTVFVEVTQDGSAVRRGMLLPNQFVVGSVTTKQDEPRLVVPRTALDGDRVMVVREEAGAARAHAAPARVLYYIAASLPELDPVEHEWAVLEHGPEPGSLVITSNLDEVREGTPVRVEARPPGPAAGSPATPVARDGAADGRAGRTP